VDLRSFLAQVERSLPGESVKVDRPVDPKFGVTAVLQRLEDMGRYPIVLFANVFDLAGNPGKQVVSNVFADRRFCAVALGLPLEASEATLTFEFAERAAAPTPVQVVPAKDAPVKEVVKLDADADLRELPVVTHHEGDGGPYLTQPVISRDPEDGVHNVAFHRLMVRGPRETGIYMAPFHTLDNYVKYESQGLPCPIAAVLGHHPTLSMAAATRVPKDVSELEIAGSLARRPLRMVASETWGEDFLVPADSEAVVEGEILPGVREEEGPFGEWTGFLGPARLRPVVRVTAITHRRDPVLVTNFVGHRDLSNLQGLSWEADVLRRARDAVPSVVAAHAPVSGRAGFHFYISMKKNHDGEPRTAAYSVLGLGYPKMVVVVDDDVDVFSDAQVLEAIATRVQASRDVEIVRGLKGSTLDPSTYGSTVHDALIVDATTPLDKELPPRLASGRGAIDGSCYRAHWICSERHGEVAGLLQGCAGFLRRRRRGEGRRVHRDHVGRARGAGQNGLR
jgi:2,5-furandicarboxylate decarboxylase 1